MNIDILENKEKKKEINENKDKIKEENLIEEKEEDNLKKEIKLSQKQNDMNEAPFVSNKIYYNCTECSSNIEIISLNEHYIKFKCNNNNHNIQMKIKDYLKKIKQFNNKILNINICEKHNEEYLSYCFDCNIHLCKECLRTGEHSYHYKIYIIEILPKNEILDKIRNLIKNNKIKIDELNKNKIEKENILNDIY